MTDKAVKRLTMAESKALNFVEIQNDVQHNPEVCKKYVRREDYRYVLTVAEHALKICYEVNQHPADGGTYQDFALAKIRAALGELI